VLAQLERDDSTVAEPRGVEPQALRDQAAQAVARAALRGWLHGTVAEYGSPHGGSWLPLLTARGLRPVAEHVPAEVIVDGFGLMHEPDQAAALAFSPSVNVDLWACWRAPVVKGPVLRVVALVSWLVGPLWSAG
jgi:hypothetical protein